MKKGEIFTVEISGMGANGEGVAKVDGAVVFVPFAIEGETAKIKITSCKKDYAFADLIEVLSASNDRIKPRCVHFGKCGGCDIQHVDYEKQLAVKRANLINNLKRIGGIEADVAEVVHADEWAYRNKLALPFGEKNGKTVVGFFEKQSHQIVPLKDCPLHGEWAKKLISCVTEWANENKPRLSVYDETSGKGFLRHAVARMLDTLSLTIVGNGKTLPAADELAKKLAQEFSDFEIYFSPNTQNTNVILGYTAKLVYGTPRKQTLGKLKAVVNPLSFLQVNSAIRDKIYDVVCDFIENNSGNNSCGGNSQNTNAIDVVELYSGVGLLTAELALRLPNAKITAVEIVPEAVKDADRLMTENGLSNRVENICGDAAAEIAKLLKAEYKNSSDTVSKVFLTEKIGSNVANASNTTVILDPPRKGCSEEVLQAILDAAPSHIVYISCNPATLARDLKILSARFAPVSIIPFDMFPQTKHLETLVCMTRK